MHRAHHHMSFYTSTLKGIIVPNPFNFCNYAMLLFFTGVIVTVPFRMRQEGNACVMIQGSLTRTLSSFPGQCIAVMPSTGAALG